MRARLLEAFEALLMVALWMVALEWSNVLFGLTNTLAGLEVCLVVLAWRMRIWPFGT
jgi:hypothetical protein